MRISLLIPTRERAATLRATLRNVSALNDPDLEIIVSDNASADDTAEVIAAMRDPRIRMIRTASRLSQRQNFEHAVSAASGDYLMMIGDDDAVLVRQWPLLRMILAKRKPDALSWPAIFYPWPGPERRGGGGRLRLSRATLFGPVIERSSAEHLASIRRLDRTREDFSPKLYHGLLSRRVIDALRAKTGMVVASGQVDAYMSAAALPFMESYLYLRHPFSILGMGPKSGGLSIAAQHRADDANDSARRVAEEAISDPVVEPFAMPLPVLGFYLLNGLEQANRMAFGKALNLDAKAYLAMIFDQLADTSPEARARGIELLTQFAREQAQTPELQHFIATRGAALMSHPAPKPAKPSHPLIRMFESLSLIEPGRIGIDLKPRGLAEIDGAARMADFLIGPSVDLTSDPASRWRAAQMRALRVIFAGAGPD
ncbi:MAG: glycosyltransferase family 2 protein [Rhizobiales bacterium]|nr:glycosyltransferase family 2 protein [Hyphomicrobiales bacterium]